MPLGCSFSTWTGETGVQSSTQAPLEAPGSRGGSGGLSKCTFLAEGPSRSSLNFGASLGHSPRMRHKVRREAGCCHHVFLTQSFCGTRFAQVIQQTGRVPDMVMGTGDTASDKADPNPCRMGLTAEATATGNVTQGHRMSLLGRP